MIPQRVYLSGFLCYRDEQEICFNGSSLWMLSGLNGSGKSAIFDAVTYALFGHHRGGGQQAVELINNDSSRLVVEFNFTLDGQVYQVRRTLQRNARGGASATQQIFQLAPDGRKEPVPDTNRKREFDAWIRDHVGLHYETFTSSVLLLQGRAEKLLDSTAAGRFEVLAGIVDLDRYRRLHERADSQRKELKANKAALEHQLDGMPIVTDLERFAVQGKIEQADETHQKQQAELQRLQELEFQARRWTELQEQLAAAQGRWRQAQQLIADAPAIEKAMGRLRELREVLPRLQVIVEQRQKIRGSESETGKLIEQKQKLADLLAEQEHALKQTLQKRNSLQNRIAEEVQKHRQVVADFRQAAALLEKLKEYERQESDLSKLLAELARLPADPTKQAAEARQVCEELIALAQVVPVLARFQGRRGELADAVKREPELLQAKQKKQEQGQRCAAKVDQLRAPLEAAAQARKQADEQATEARTLLQQARQHLGELTQLGGAKVCRHCGQPLTLAHLADEKRRREKEIAAAEERFQQWTAVQKEAIQREQEQRAQMTAAEQDLVQTREEFRDLRNLADQARKESERLQAECGQLYHELPEGFRKQVQEVHPANWSTTVYPTEEELRVLRGEANGLEAARRRLREMEQVQLQWSTLKAQEADKRQGLSRLEPGLPADRQTVRQEHTRLESDEQSLDRSLAARRAEVQDSQQQLERLTREREQTQHQLVKIEGQLQTEETTRQLCQQTLNRARQEIPPSWQTHAERAGLAALHEWASERDQLTAQATESRFEQLQQARAGLSSLSQSRTDLESQCERFPAEARQAPAEVQALVVAARQELAACDATLRQAQQAKALLDSQCQQRETVQQLHDNIDRELCHYNLLTQLLGRDRLQRYLVRQAERQVVDHANAVLDRLSGGQLALRLRGGDEADNAADKALELEAYNRVTGQAPINVAFLSGSQRFRVAVSLALGIGQYASRQHRPIESVIIDEGFGCLDRQGRQVMIQELQNLRSHMRCILLVSHQEEFAEAFAEGYRFELRDGTTVATRFQR